MPDERDKLLIPMCKDEREQMCIVWSGIQKIIGVVTQTAISQELLADD